MPAATERQMGYLLARWGADPTWASMPRPEASQDEVLVEVEACGVGLTVLNCIRGDLADERATLPRVPGHEIVGRVVDAGPGSGEALVGRRVVAYFYLSCGRCGPCLADAEPRCEALAGWIGVHRDGGYAPFACLPSFNAIPIDEEVEPTAATVIPDAVATAVHVCRGRANVASGERVAVIGAGGGVGIHLVQVARWCGAEVVGLDVGPAKLEALRSLDIEPVDSTDFERLVGTWSGPPDVIVDLVGSEASLTWALAAVRDGGRIAVLTTFRDRAVPIEPRTMVLGELALVGSKYASRADVRTAAELVASGQVRPIVGSTVAPEGIPGLHERLRAGDLVGRGALRW